MLDLVIRGGTLVDGTGAPRRRADVGIRQGKVVAVGSIDAPSGETLDAGGLVVAPGFVDIHTHYDAQILWDPALTPSSLHGVTTAIGGNCGFTLAPIGPAHTDYITRMLARVEGMPLASLRAGIPYDWKSFGEYLERVGRSLAINAGFLVGHCALRRVVMGEESVEREASPDEIGAMCALLAESLAAGGLGFSSTQAATHSDGDGRPVPSRAASREELLALCRVVGEHPGTTLEFIPSSGLYGEVHRALMADMSTAANRPLNWNALAPSAEMADYAWEMLASCDYAAERGGHVRGLTIPDPLRAYMNFGTSMVFDAFPGWAEVLHLPQAERLRALGDGAVRERLEEGARRVEGPLANVADWAAMVISQTFADANRGLAGRRIGEIAAERGCTPFDALLDVVVADELRTVLEPKVIGDDEATWMLRRELWRDPRTIVGASDAGAHLDMLSTFSFSTQILRAVREREVVTLEEGVRLITDDPARLYGLEGRGRVAEGWHADLVVFDPERVAPAPVHWRDDLPGGAGRLYAEAEGIEHVYVAGREIVRGGALSEERPGRLLRSGRDTKTVEASTLAAVASATHERGD